MLLVDAKVGLKLLLLEELPLLLIVGRDQLQTGKVPGIHTMENQEIRYITFAECREPVTQL